jgi:uncharacterized membrane protein YdjX (TVP38/TMEM64 family)
VPDTESFLVRKRRLIAVVLFLAATLGFVELFGIRENFDLDYVRDTLAMHPVSGGALFVALFCLGNLIQIPGWIFLAAAVLTLGKVDGGSLTYLAAVVSCVVTYALIRMLGGDALRELDSPLARRLLGYMDERPLLSIFALRTCFQTAPPLNYSLALSGVPFRQYLVGTVLGLPLPIVAYCLAFELLFDGLL